MSFSILGKGKSNSPMCVARPQYVKRERVAETWEFRRFRKAASQEVWWVIIPARHTGMRESMLIDMREDAVRDGCIVW
jgi:hypothetical protein